MGERLSLYVPFVLAVLFPPVGLLLGLIGLQDGERDKGIRLLIVSVLAAAIWAFIFLV